MLRSHVRSWYVHVLFVIFVVLPLTYSNLNPLEQTESQRSIRILSISDKEYRKMLQSKPNLNPIKQPHKKPINVVKKDNQTNKKSSQINSRSAPPPRLDKAVETQKQPSKRIQDTKKLDQIIDAISKPDIVPKPTKTTAVNTKNLVDNDIVNQIINAQIKNPIETLRAETQYNPQYPISNIIDPSNPQEAQKANMENHDETLFDAQSFANEENVISEEVYLSVYDIITSQFSRCWDQYYDQIEDRNIAVVAIVSLYPDGNVAKVKIKSQFHFNPTARKIYNKMSQNVQKSIIQCAPISGLPVERYDEWRIVQLNFKSQK